ncbi:transposase [Candidatus Poribacteria bacterium]|nr:transposase [Candidatus Poribacteria bacterium]
MVKNFKYRIYPKKSQQSRLNQTLEECRWLYNHLLQQRQTEWEEHKQSLSCFGQQRTYKALKQERPTLQTVHSQVLQNVAVRIDLAFKAFFRRVRNGETPGYPRFRGRLRYDSITYPQYGNGATIHPDGSLQLSKIGRLKIVYHRPIEGVPKTVTIQRVSTGKWYATIACEIEENKLPDNPNAVGIDVGLTRFAVLSTGEVIDNPRFFQAEEKELAKAQRKLSGHEKGTKEYRKRKKVVARIYERIVFKRHHFTHQHSRKIVDRFGLIAVEEIHVNRMIHHHCLAKSILDAAWSGFFFALMYKAACAGHQFVAVNPAYTSQNCSRCGHRQSIPLTERIYRCPCCQLEMGRDFNAARNILALGRQCLVNA